MFQKILLGTLLTWLFVSSGLDARAQEVPIDPYQEFREPGDAVPLFGNDDELSAPGYESAETLYQELIKPGRCLEKRSERRGIPCALIKYPGSGAYRPVFKIVGRKTIWTFLDTYLAEVTIQDLFEASDFSGPAGELRRYPPIDVIGFEENASVCGASGDSCVDQKHFTRFLEDRDTLTMGCRSAIWGNQSDPNEKHLSAGCRVYMPGN